MSEQSKRGARGATWNVNASHPFWQGLALPFAGVVSGGPDRQTDIQDRSANNAMGAIVILRHTVYEAATTDAKEGMNCPSVANIGKYEALQRHSYFEA